MSPSLLLCTVVEVPPEDVVADERVNLAADAKASLAREENDEVRGAGGEAKEESAVVRQDAVVERREEEEEEKEEEEKEEEEKEEEEKEEEEKEEERNGDVAKRARESEEGKSLPRLNQRVQVAKQNLNPNGHLQLLLVLMLPLSAECKRPSLLASLAKLVATMAAS